MLKQVHSTLYNEKQYSIFDSISYHPTQSFTGEIVKREINVINVEVVLSKAIRLLKANVLSKTASSK